jgi:uncharacterized membrane protein YgdD (TMEM256/DUF423 family)
MKSNTLIIYASLLGASGVILGAFGAHALKFVLTQHGMAEVWDTAVRYQLIHAVALLALGGFYANPHYALIRSKLCWVVRFWIAGVFLFSVSLYLLALGGPRWLGPITPLGGISLIAGWVILGLVAVRSNND